MNRDERGALAIGAALVAGVVLGFGLTGWLHALAGSVVFNAGANVIQWISGPLTLAGVSMLLWHRWARTCKVPWCLRLGDHGVAGTCVKVCTKHHLAHVHERLYRRHRRDGAGELAHGESHDTGGTE